MITKRKKRDLTDGPILTGILAFALPLMLSGMLQLTFNAVDSIVVGRYAGDAALAAVGSTGSLVGLIINVMTGLSVGAGVNIAQRFGSGDGEGVSRYAHTAIAVSLLGGVLFAAVGFLGAPLFLELMNSPPDVIGLSTLYIRIYFLGLPFSMLYNFGASILRSVGNTKKPLLFLSLAGVLNVLLNLVFVIGFSMGVAGVAIATVISQMLSATLVLLSLIRSEGCYRIDLRELRIHRTCLSRMFMIGIPSGLQSGIFSLTNVIVQSSVNSFEKMAMSGNAASGNIESFIFMAMNAFHQTALTFVGQNVGAGKYKRVNKIMFTCLSLVALVGFSLGAIAYLLRYQLLGIWLPDSPQAVEYGIMRMGIITVTYFLNGMMDTLTGGIRGLGNSLAPMLVSLIGTCGLQILWIYTVFAWHRTIFILFLSYPITWAISIVAELVCFLLIKGQLEKKRFCPQDTE